MQLFLEPTGVTLSTFIVSSYGLAVAAAGKESCCAEFASAGLRVLHEDDEQYRIRTNSYWSLSTHMAPTCIVQPTSTEEVSKAVKLLVDNATCRQADFAIRSGGHTTWAGSNNIDGGVTLDLGLMNQTNFEPSNNLASIQPGSLWNQVYATLDPLGVTVAGGRAGTVGVAGFLMGGGNSFYTSQQGFACDNVKNFEVVLASGEIIDANATDNSDLFQVLKGGSGSNFGVVTRFDVQAFGAGNLWGGAMAYPKSVGQQHIEAYHDWTKNVNNYTEGSAIVFWSYLPVMADIAILAAYEDTAGTIAPPGFEKIMAIPDALSSTMRIASHKELTDELEQAPGYYDVWYTLTFRNDVKIYKRIVQLHEQFVGEWKVASSDPDFITQLMFQSIATGFSEHGVAKGGNVLGLDLETENVVMLLYNIAVKSPELEALAREKLFASFQAMKKYAASVDGLINWTYLNYADGTQDPLTSYGAENVAKIRAAALKYDPDQVFQTRVPGGFKISNVKGDGRKTEL